MAEHDIDPELRSLLTIIYTLLPFEIVTKILDYAEVWVCDFSTTLSPQSPPLARYLEIAEVVISFTSKDQGWSSYPKFHGTYEGSWTWFDVALLSPAEVEARSAQATLQNETACSVPPRTYRLQCNRHAGKEMESYIIYLDKSQGYPLFDDLCERDSITLMAGAMFPGWTNMVKSASLQLWKADFHGVPRSLV